MAKIVTADYDIDLEIPSLKNMTDDEFFNFCVQNKKTRIERDENHQIYVMPPVGNDSSAQNSILTFELVSWNKKNKKGIVFDSSAGFFLPDKSMRSPDSAWISNERWLKISALEKKKFAHITPDFVIELMSNSDRIDQLKKKMEKWIENGVLLAWLIIPQTQQSFVYRKNGTVDAIENFDKELSGENVLPGFILNLKELIKT
ncbi:MAG: Uma2 family endonuclease [Bacteroidota bacterium]|nr:Uma2 family endonuclease [Bacteroidota bacterium]